MSKSIVRRFAAIFGSNMVTIVAAFLATPVIVRLLGTSEYGNYAFMLSILSTLILFANAGIFDGIRKYLKESNREEEWSEQVFGFYSRLGLGLAVITVLGTVALVETGVIRRYLGATFELYFLLVALIVGTQQAFSISRGSLMGFDREDVSEKLMIANRLLAIGVGLVLLWSGYGVAGLLAGKLIANAVTAVIGLFVLRRFIDLSGVVSGGADDFPRRSLITFNVMTTVLFVLFISIKHADVILIQSFYGSTQTAYYKAALNLAEFVWFVPRMVQTALLHSTSELWSEDRHQAITNISSRVTRYSLLFTVLLVIGLGALAEPTVNVYYGEGYQRAVLPLIVLLPGTVGFAVARPILAIGQGKGAFRYLIFATGGAATLNLVLNLLLIPRFGIVGAAIATSIGYFSMMIFHVAGARAIGFNPIADLRLPNVLTTFVVAAGAISFLAALVDSILWSLIIVPPVGFLLYSGIAIAAGAISLDELQELRDQVRV